MSVRFRYYGEFTEVIDKARAAGEAWYPSDDERFYLHVTLKPLNR